MVFDWDREPPKFERRSVREERLEGVEAAVMATAGGCNRAVAELGMPLSMPPPRARERLAGEASKSCPSPATKGSFLGISLTSLLPCLCLPLPTGGGSLEPLPPKLLLTGRDLLAGVAGFSGSSAISVH
jgi:hypothetical protein